MKKIKIIVELFVATVLKSFEIVREVDFILIIETVVKLEGDHDESKDSLEDARKLFAFPRGFLWFVRDNFAANGEELKRGKSGHDVNLQYVRET